MQLDSDPSPRGTSADGIAFLAVSSGINGTNRAIEVASGRPRSEEVEERAQSFCVVTQRRERLKRFTREPSHFALARLDSVDHGVGEFAGGSVLSRGFSRVFRALRRVDQVVDDLEHKSRAATERRESFDSRGVRISSQRTHAAGRFEQRARLVVVDQLELRGARKAVGKSLQRVVDLPRNHAHGRGEERVLNERGVGARTRRRQRCKREQAVACKDRHRFAKRDMASGFAATEHIVVERRKVIVHEAKRVHTFDGDGRGHRVVDRSAGRARAFEHEQRAQSLATREQRVLARRAEILRDFALRHEPLQRVLDLLEQLRVER